MRRVAYEAQGNDSSRRVLLELMVSERPAPGVSAHGQAHVMIRLELLTICRRCLSSVLGVCSMRVVGVIQVTGRPHMLNEIAA